MKKQNKDNKELKLFDWLGFWEAMIITLMFMIPISLSIFIHPIYILFGVLCICLPLVLDVLDDARLSKTNKYTYNRNIFHLTIGALIGFIVPMLFAYSISHNHLGLLWFLFPILIMETIFWMIPFKPIKEKWKRIGIALLNKIWIYAVVLIAEISLMGLSVFKTLIKWMIDNISQVLSILGWIGIVLACAAVFIGYLWINSLKFKPKNNKKIKHGGKK